MGNVSRPALSDAEHYSSTECDEEVEKYCCSRREWWDSRHPGCPGNPNPKVPKRSTKINMWPGT